MTSELLSIIQFACLIFSGLLAVCVTVFVIWQSSRPTQAASQSHFGVSVALATAHNMPPCMIAPQAHARCGLASNSASAHSATALAARALDAAASDPSSSSVDGMTLSALGGSYGNDFDPLTGGRILVLQESGRREVCRAWLLDEALPKLTANGYEGVAA